MSSSCVACRTRGSGMVAIFQHPNGLDQMFCSVTGIEVEHEDHLCIPCYDDLKAAHLFKQKCIQNNILRVSRPGRSTAAEEKRASPDKDSTPSTNTKDETVPIAEISTTSVVREADILEEHLYLSEGDEEESRDEDGGAETEVMKISLENVEEVPGSSIHLENSTAVESKQAPVPSSSVQLGIKIVEAVKLEPIHCEECGKSFSKTSLFQKHVKSCHQAESTDEASDQQQQQDEPEHGSLATLPTVHNLMCEFCFQEFPQLAEKFEHEASHVSEQKPYKCPQCRSAFKDKVGLRSHIRIHSSVKRFKCQFCEMRFHQRGNLKAHERIHVGAKPYLCPHCGKGFAENGNLKNHIRFHTGEKPYSCSQCTKRFRTHYSRTIHMRSHSNDRPFKCSHAGCDKSFYSSGKLIVHRRVHSGEKPYHCDTCSAKFADSSGLRRHSKTH
ncbi:gastrula zinc finger protein XLCGF48.2 [Culex quinquefasciatus]|uniref:Gastrula zinc finger protein XLCGF48.2 n=1 Tax=Culex quinquefasciatus TaxID=7176 RepID=B0W1Q4_CULQU|nr:gastrula zinc finger protein XLCGF48.2 [Culex quinquefasciatus]|eukprot:XP_001842638.1 gastrula zinc finger protein XLCGF48.2 [Culex quinquefasciatus]